MKNSGKIVGSALLCMIIFLGYSAKASTGDDIGTGSITTGGITTGSTSTGSIVSGTLLSYTGSLLGYLTTQESSISSGFSTVYAKLYAAFAKTGLNILKSIDYQSLVCLGAIKEVSLLSQLQKDKTTLTISFKQDFIDLENQVLALEEKKDLQESDNVNVFDSGTTYETEKNKLKDLIDTKVKLHKGFITSFETTYLAKNIDFLSTFQQYSLANKDLIKTIQDKMARIQTILTAFTGVETTINTINTKVMGLDDIFQKMEDTKNKGIINLDRTLQSLILTNSTKYKKLQNMIDELTKQKTYVIGQYQMDFDEYLTTNFQNRYNRSQYLALKEQVNNFKAKFYTPTNQLNCSNIFSPSDEGTAILAKITAMKTAVNSGLAKIEAEEVSTAFKDQIYSGFQSVYIQKFKQRYTEYTNYIKEYITTALKNFVASIVSPTTDTPKSTTSITYVFTRPFKSGEYGEGVKVLQNLLTTLQLYSGAIDGIYNKITKNAVYQFQLSRGLLKGYQNKPSVWGRMGPATRAALNKLTQ